jgi:hypothetical protein
MHSTSSHMHCRNYAPIDAIKGVCHVSKEIVPADGAACPSFDRLPRCSECEHYLPSDEQYLGICQATEGRPMTYPDLTAVTCEWFEWKAA